MNITIATKQVSVNTEINDTLIEVSNESVLQTLSISKTIRTPFIGEPEYFPSLDFSDSRNSQYFYFL